jgi:hypothetical protein
MDAAMMTAAIAGWPFKPGDKVTVKPGHDWRADWQGVVLEVTGCFLDRQGYMRVMVSENYPRDGGTDDMLADDLSPA